MFRVGNVVRVLRWEEMVKRSQPFHGDPNRRVFDDGKADWLFVESMRRTCGRMFTIKNIAPVDGTSEKEYQIGTCDQAHPEAPGHPLTNYMVELAVSKYPTNQGVYKACSK